MIFLRPPRASASLNCRHTCPCAGIQQAIDRKLVNDRIGFAGPISGQTLGRPTPSALAMVAAPQQPQHGKQPIRPAASCRACNVACNVCAGINRAQQIWRAAHQVGIRRETKKIQITDRGFCKTTALLPKMPKKTEVRVRCPSRLGPHVEDTTRLRSGIPWAKKWPSERIRKRVAGQTHPLHSC
jgi:hypothetical protein